MKIVPFRRHERKKSRPKPDAPGQMYLFPAKQCPHAADLTLPPCPFRIPGRWCWTA